MQFYKFFCLPLVFPCLSCTLHFTGAFLQRVLVGSVVGYLRILRVPRRECITDMLRPRFQIAIALVNLFFADKYLRAPTLYLRLCQFTSLKERARARALMAMAKYQASWKTPSQLLPHTSLSLSLSALPAMAANNRWRIALQVKSN